MQAKRQCKAKYHALLLTIVLFLPAAFLSVHSSQPKAYAADDPAYHVYLFEDSGVVDCADSCSYSENHVYSVAQPYPIGYRDGAGGTVILDNQDEQIGYLAVP